MVRIMPNQTRRGAACAASPVLGLAMAARQRQDLSRHSAASPAAHILAEGDRTAWLTMQSAANISAPCAIYRTRAPMDALGQLGVEHDLGLENLGDWAVLLGVSRQIGELCFVEVGHFGVQRQS
jgi:hypothetical protein